MSARLVEALRLVDAFEVSVRDDACTGHTSAKAYMELARRNLNEAIAALAEAEAQPMQEPVAYRGLRTEWPAAQDSDYCYGPWVWGKAKPPAGVEPLYAAPPQPVPLTDKQLAQIWDDALNQIDPRDQMRFVARAIERAHGIGGKP